MIDRFLKVHTDAGIERAGISDQIDREPESTFEIVGEIVECEKGNCILLEDDLVMSVYIPFFLSVKQMEHIHTEV